MKIADVIQAVSDETGVSVAALKATRRDFRTARARQVAMFVARRLTGETFAVIGRAFNRDHTTVLHAIQVMNQLVAEDRGQAEWIEGLESRLCEAEARKAPKEECMTRMGLGAAALAVAMTMTGPASAQGSLCGQASAVIRDVERSVGPNVGGGVVMGDIRLELFVGGNRASVVMITPDHAACILWTGRWDRVGELGE